MRNVPRQAAYTGIQSPAAAMGAGPLGNVTLPVWAQPWSLVLCVVLGVAIGPKFEPNKFGVLKKKSSGGGGCTPGFGRPDCR